VQLSETEELQDLGGLWVSSHDTSDTDNENNLGLGWDQEVASILGLTLETDGVALFVTVLLDVGLGTFEDDLSCSLSLFGLFEDTNVFLGF